jgi:hypothetical protein
MLQNTILSHFGRQSALHFGAPMKNVWATAETATKTFITGIPMGNPKKVRTQKWTKKTKILSGHTDMT